MFLAEAVEVYWLSLHYRSDAYLYAVIAVGLGAVLSVRVSPRQRAGAWLAALTLLGIAGFYVVGQVATSAVQTLLAQNMDLPARLDGLGVLLDIRPDDEGLPAELVLGVGDVQRCSGQIDGAAAAGV